MSQVLSVANLLPKVEGDPLTLKIVAKSEMDFEVVKMTNSCWVNFCCCCCSKTQEKRKEALGIQLFRQQLEEAYTVKITEIVLDSLNIDLEVMSDNSKCLTYNQALAIENESVKTTSLLENIDNRLIAKKIAYFLLALKTPKKIPQKLQKESVNVQLFFKIKSELSDMLLDRNITEVEMLIIAQNIFHRMEENGVEKVNHEDAEVIIVEELMHHGFKIHLPHALFNLPLKTAYLIMRYTVEDMSEQKLWGKLFYHYLAYKYGTKATNLALKKVTITHPIYSDRRIIDWGEIEALSLQEAFSLDEVAKKFAEKDTAVTPLLVSPSISPLMPIKGLSSPTVSRVDKKEDFPSFDIPGVVV